jgi:hypothetical protein
MAQDLSKVVEYNRDLLEIVGNVDLTRGQAADLLLQRGVVTSDRSVARWREKHPEFLFKGAYDKPTNRTPPGKDSVKDEEEAPALFDVEDAYRKEMDAEKQISDLRARNRRLFEAVKKEKNRRDELVQAVYDASASAIEANPRDFKSVAYVPRSSGKRKPEFGLWHSTDWQTGKKTSSYNAEVAKERVEEYVHKALSLTDIQRADHPVDHAVVLLTGDMVEGCNIFPGQAYELDITLFDQVFHTANLLEWMVREALANHKTIDVVGEWGNHGRLGRKGEYKAGDNMDRMVYEIVKQRLSSQNDRILNFKVSDDWYQHHTVGNYSFMAVHGDEIKSFGGNTPAFGILRKCNAWATGVVPSFRDVYMGHYHQSMQLQIANGGSVFMTGSTESDNTYAKEFVAATGDPSQRVNFIDPERGRVTAEYRVWLSTEK